MAGIKEQLKDRAKKHLCSRDLSAGDLVRVTDGAKWKPFQHKIGGTAHWAIFVKKNGKKALVRPMRANGMFDQPVEVSGLEHIDDVVQNTAIKEFYDKRGGGEE